MRRARSGSSPPGLCLLCDGKNTSIDSMVAWIYLVLFSVAILKVVSIANCSGGRNAVRSSATSRKACNDIIGYRTSRRGSPPAASRDAEAPEDQASAPHERALARIGAAAWIFRIHPNPAVLASAF